MNIAEQIIFDMDLKDPFATQKAIQKCKELAVDTYRLTNNARNDTFFKFVDGSKNILMHKNPADRYDEDLLHTYSYKIHGPIHADREG